VSKARSRPFEIVYESADLIAVDKPAGLPVIASDNSRERNLYSLVSDYLGRGNRRVHVALVHRIDRDTSGLVLFAKNPRMKKLLMENWNELVRVRRYVAVAEGRMESEAGTLDTWLAQNRAGEVYQLGAAGGGIQPDRRAQRAITHWKRLGAGGGLSLLELELETGRKHQIRVQLAAAGHPVLGDPKYGGRGRHQPAAGGPLSHGARPLGRTVAAPDSARPRFRPSPRDMPQRLCLHSSYMELEHPLSREIIVLRSPAPPGFGQLVTP
jgi:23S rRNA pseudouridine1911/1915/1917 synthase